MMETYEGREDLTLFDLKIYPMKTLVLEERKSKDIPFEAFDPTLMQIKVVIWTPDIYKDHTSLMDFTEEKSGRIRIPKQMLFSEFK